jgi:hypothetical protein
MCIHATDIAVERHSKFIGSGSRYGKRYTKDRIRPKAALVISAIKFEKDSINVTLIKGIETDKGVVDLVVDMGNSIKHTFTHVAGFAIAQFNGLKRAGRCTRGNYRSTIRTRFEDDLNLDGRVTAAVEDLAAGDVFDNAHGIGGSSSMGLGWKFSTSTREQWGRSDIRAHP